VPKPRARVMTPDEIERLRVAMPTLRDRALLGLLAYAGPRPEEALALRWVDVGRLLVIDRAFTHREEAGTKTNHRRTVEIIKPLAADLEELRARSVGEGLVAPSETGAHGRLGHWRNRVWTPPAAQLASSTPVEEAILAARLRTRGPKPVARKLRGGGFGALRPLACDGRKRAHAGRKRSTRGRIRTCDLWLRRPALYPLSYARFGG
jgi:hypothetical protein